MPCFAGLELVSVLQQVQELSVRPSIAITANITLRPEYIPVGGINIFRNITIYGAPDNMTDIVSIDMRGLANILIIQGW